MQSFNFFEENYSRCILTDWNCSDLKSTASLAHQEFYHTEYLFSFQSSNYNQPSLINLNLFPQRVPVQLRKRAGQLVQRHHGAGEPPRGSRLPAVDVE